MNNEIISKKLIELRGGMNKRYVATTCGISVSALNMYEQGKRIPRDDIKVKIAGFYGCSVESIFFPKIEHDMCLIERGDNDI